MTLVATGTAQVAAEPPAPTRSASAPGKPVAVFILMGQSNMVGFGRIALPGKKGTLEVLCKEEGKYPHLLDAAGKWTERDEVWCVKTTVGQAQGWLKPGFGARADFIGPELQFGHVMGDLHEEPVLLIKASQGNRSLGWDILPPGSEWFEHGDQNAAHASRYESNLVRLIQCLRAEFDAPKAPLVIATIAFGGEKLAGHGLTIANAQLAVSGETGRYPEFAGNVKTVDARPFWRDESVSPNDRQDYHYYHNAETYMEVGNALGVAMAELLGKR